MLQMPPPGCAPGTNALPLLEMIVGQESFLVKLSSMASRWNKCSNIIIVLHKKYASLSTAVLVYCSGIIRKRNLLRMLRLASDFSSSSYENNAIFIAFMSQQIYSLTQQIKPETTNSNPFPLLNLCPCT